MISGVIYLWVTRAPCLSKKHPPDQTRPKTSTSSNIFGWMNLILIAVWNKSYVGCISSIKDLQWLFGFKKDGSDQCLTSGFKKDGSDHFLTNGFKKDWSDHCLTNGFKKDGLDHCLINGLKKDWLNHCLINGKKGLVKPMLDEWFNNSHLKSSNLLCTRVTFLLKPANVGCKISHCTLWRLPRSDPRVLMEMRFRLTLRVSMRENHGWYLVCKSLQGFKS